MLGNCMACAYQIAENQILKCEKCKKLVCNVCILSGECPSCIYDLPKGWEPQESTDANILQKGIQGTLKKGSLKLLISGVEKSRLLASHNIRPRFVQKVIRQELVRGVHITTTVAQKKP